MTSSPKHSAAPLLGFQSNAKHTPKTNNRPLAHSQQHLSFDSRTTSPDARRVPAPSSKSSLLSVESLHFHEQSAMLKAGAQASPLLAPTTRAQFSLHNDSTLHSIDDRSIPTQDNSLLNPQNSTLRADSNAKKSPGAPHPLFDGSLDSFDTFIGGGGNKSSGRQQDRKAQERQFPHAAGVTPNTSDDPHQWFALPHTTRDLDSSTTTSDTDSTLAFDDSDTHSSWSSQFNEPLKRPSQPSQQVPTREPTRPLDSSPFKHDKSSSSLHPSPHTSHAFQIMYKEEKFFDVSFLVGKQEFKCHACVLSQSKYLRERMRRRRKRIDLPGMDERTWYTLLQYMYGLPQDLSSFDRKAYQRLVVAAKYYSLKQLEAYLSHQYVTRFVTEKNVLSIIRVAQEKKLKHLRKCAVEYLAQNFETIKSSKKVQDIERDLLWEILNTVLNANSVHDSQLQDDSMNRTKGKQLSTSSGLMLHEEALDPLAIYREHMINLLKHCADSVESSPVPRRITVVCNDSVEYAVDACLLRYHFGFFSLRSKEKRIQVPMSSQIMRSVLQILYLSFEGELVLDDLDHCEYLLCGMLMLEWNDRRKLRLRSTDRFNVKLFLQTLYEHGVKPPDLNGGLFKGVILPLLSQKALLELVWQWMSDAHARENSESK